MFFLSFNKHIYITLIFLSHGVHCTNSQIFFYLVFLSLLCHVMFIQRLFHLCAKKNNVQTEELKFYNSCVVSHVYIYMFLFFSPIIWEIVHFYVVEKPTPPPPTNKITMFLNEPNKRWLFCSLRNAHNYNQHTGVWKHTFLYS